MRWLRGLSLLSLALLALYLSARNVAAEGPSQPNQSTQTQTPAEEHSSVPSTSISPTYQPTAAPTPHYGTTYIYNEYYQTGPLGNLPTWLEAIATIGLLVFAGWEVDYVRRSTAATEIASKAASDNAIAAKDAAEATKRYAEVAKLALRAERPFLFIEEQSVHSHPIAKSFNSLKELLTGKFERPDITRDTLSQKDKYESAELQMSFVLFNRGRGIAIIDRIKIKTLLGHGMIKGGKEKMLTGGRFEVTVAAQMLRPDRGAKFFAPSIEFSLDLFADIVELRKGLLILLLIQCHDVYRRPFTTIQPLAYHPPIRRRDGTIIEPENLVPQRHDRPRYF
jgi:hypothetical protein